MASRAKVLGPPRGVSAGWLAGSWVGSVDSLKVLDGAIGDAVKTLGPDFSPGAVMLCIRFKNDFSIVGEARRNLGDSELSLAPIKGSFTADYNAVMHWIEGEIRITRGSSNNIIRYVRVSDDELQILLGNVRADAGNSPGNLAQGVLRRVAPVVIDKTPPIREEEPA